MEYGLKPKYINILMELFSKYAQIEEVIIFGSRATGKYRPTSDVDLALKGDIDLDITAKIKYILEEETIIPFFFDIVNYQSLTNKELKQRIDTEGKIIYKKKTYHDLGGTFRSDTPAETLSRLEPLLAKLGITRIANVSGLDHCGIDVATCIRPNSKHLSVSQGKGLSLDLAKISAIMESIEGYHAECPPETTFTDSYNDLAKQHNVINPRTLSLTTFRDAEIENMQIEWIEAHDIANNKLCYIPKILTCLDFVNPHPEYAFFNTSSNGFAAGNTKDEAICHSLYELIERDSLFKWQVISDEERDQTQLDIDTITTGINKLVIDKFINSNHLIKVWETTSELGIPAYHCAICDPNSIRRLGVFTGTGAHLSKYVALSRALTEAAQSKLTVISGSRDDIFPNYYERMETENATISTTDFEPGIRDYANCTNPDFSWSFTDNISYLVNRLKQHGFKQIILIDHTKPDINIPVVQTLVPGLGFNNSRI